MPILAHAALPSVLVHASGRSYFEKNPTLLAIQPMQIPKDLILNST
jgi:hypothetical protein